jgi:hypothetical protein
MTPLKSVTGIKGQLDYIDFFKQNLLSRLVLPSVQNTLQPGTCSLGTDPRYPFHLPLPVPIEHATVMLGGTTCQHSFHAPFEAEQVSQLPFLSQNEIVYAAWYSMIFPYP